jgi:hypothetical protein
MHPADQAHLLGAHVHLFRVDQIIEINADVDMARRAGLSDSCGIRVPSSAYIRAVPV